MEIWGFTGNYTCNNRQNGSYKNILFYDIIQFMEQRLSIVTLGVSDLGVMRKFYEALGWVASSASQGDVVFFQAGGVVLALYPLSIVG